MTPPPTWTPSATPTAPNLLQNPSFEGQYTDGLASGWRGYACAPEFIGDTCLAPRQGTGNPVGLTMMAPEWAMAWVGGDKWRVHNGTLAQRWFKSYGTYQAGVYQVVAGITPGQTCVFEAYVHVWSNSLDDPYREFGHVLSELDTPDDRVAAAVWLKVDPDGLLRFFSESLISSREFGYDDGIYDYYPLYPFRLTFQPDSPTVTVMIETLFRWPKGNTDSYLDDASLRCE